tara:strand:- start:1544 stop:3322 length:1779 start_codon:yes stop_codon:yes gene_type:complete
MAIGRITGQMLSANLARSGTDLTFETNLLALDVGNSRVGIGTASPATTLHISATDSLRLPSGNTGQRPGSPANGDIRYNTSTSTIEGYVNGAYANLASGSELKDADEDTFVNVELTSDDDTIRINAGGSQIIKGLSSAIEFGSATSLSTTATTLTGLITNGDITLTPNGTGKVSISSALEVTGNLTVNGTTTTIDSTTLVVEDPLIQLAKNNSGGSANTFDQGLFFNRGSDANVSFLWDESEDQFAFAVTSGEDGTTAGNVTIDSYADIRAKNVIATDLDGILGSNTAAAATVTTLNASSTVSLDGGNVTINDSSASVDFRVESNGHAHALFVDGSEDHVGIKTASPAYDLDVSGSTDALRVPVGTTAQRPSAATGIIRFNSTLGKYEGCQDGSTFVELAVAGDTPTISKVSTTGDGSTTTFSGFFSSAPAGVANVLVFIDNVYQEPTENYSVSSTNITFTSAPHNGARIFAIVGLDNTALASGGVARTETSSTNFTSTATTIMSFNAATYRAAELFIKLEDSDNTEYAVMKANVVHNGSTAFGNIYGVVNSAGESSDLATITFEHDGSNTVNVKAATTGGTTAAVVQYSLC